MKTIAIRTLIVILVFVAAVGHTQTAATIQAADKYTPKVNDVLLYHATTPTGGYDLQITIKTISPGISYDWKMLNGATQQGTVNLTKAMVYNSTGIATDFSDIITDLSGRTIGFASMRIAKMVQAGMETDITINSDVQTSRLKPVGKATLSTTINTAAKNLAYTKTELTSTVNGNFYQFGILDNPAYPLIIFTKTSAGTLELKSITQQ